MKIRGSPEVEDEIEEIKTSCQEAQRLKEESGICFKTMSAYLGGCTMYQSTMHLSPCWDSCTLGLKHVLEVQCTYLRGIHKNWTLYSQIPCITSS